MRFLFFVFPFEERMNRLTFMMGISLMFRTISKDILIQCIVLQPDGLLLFPFSWKK